MTQLKKLKQAIRERSRKTGESYTAARHHVLIAREKRRSEWRPRAATASAAPRPSARGGMSDAAVVKKTGYGFDHWFAVLDALGAPTQGHTASARHLREGHGVPGWHAQMITVAYERARGLRVTNQACTGDFQVSVSKAVPSSAADVSDVLASAQRRAEWLEGVDPGLRRALNAAFAGDKPQGVTLKTGRYARLRYRWDGSVVEIRITSKPKGGASVVADNSKLADAALVEQRRSQWRVALDALRAHLSR